MNPRAASTQPVGGFSAQASSGLQSPVALAVSWRTAFFFKYYLFISFAPTKETNQRKIGRKRQPQPVCPLCAQSH